MSKNYVSCGANSFGAVGPDKAPSEEGAVSEADWGRENPAKSRKYQQNCKLFSPSVTASPCYLISA